MNVYDRPGRRPATNTLQRPQNTAHTHVAITMSRQIIRIRRHYTNSNVQLLDFVYLYRKKLKVFARLGILVPTNKASRGEAICPC